MYKYKVEIYFTGNTYIDVTMGLSPKNNLLMWFDDPTSKQIYLIENDCGEKVYINKLNICSIKTSENVI